MEGRVFGNRRKQNTTDSLVCVHFLGKGTEPDIEKAPCQLKVVGYLHSISSLFKTHSMKQSLDLALLMWPRS